MFRSDHSNGVYYLWFNAVLSPRRTISIRAERKSGALVFLRELKQ
jgi:hypothetical protein